MRLEQLPTLAHGVNGLQLQREVWRALNYVQVQVDMTKGETGAADALRKFLTDCVALVPATKASKAKEKTNA